MNKGNISPTHTKMRELQNAVKSARVAASMLFKKSQVFDMYLKDYGKKLKSNTELIDIIMHDAFIVLSAARYVFAPANLTVFTQCMVPEEASLRVVWFCDRFLGNAKFFSLSESQEKENEMWPMAGLSKGAAEILKTKEIFRKAAEICVGQLTLKNVFISLSKAKEVEMRKVVVIEKIVIPNMQQVIANIINYLDDVERDDNYRYKLVKKRHSRKLYVPEPEKTEKEQQQMEEKEKELRKVKEREKEQEREREKEIKQVEEQENVNVMNVNENINLNESNNVNEIENINVNENENVNE